MTFSERKAIRIAARRISASTGMNRRDAEYRLHCRDTEEEILDDHAMCLLLGIPLTPVPFWRLVFRSEKYGSLREEDVEDLILLLDMIDAAVKETNAHDPESTRMQEIAMTATVVGQPLSGRE